MIQPRHYQNQSISLLSEKFKKNLRKLVLILPPGAGKTVIAGKMLHTTIQRHPALFIADREELITQARDKFYEQFGVEAGMIKSGYKPDRTMRLQIASIQTLVRRELPPAKLVVVDECHVSISPQYLKILQYYYNQGAYIVGLTGTPWRTRKTEGLNVFYEDFVANITKSQLLHEGHLVPMKVYAAKNIIEQKFKMKGGDFDSNEVMKAFDKQDVYKNLITAYSNYIKDKKTIVFCCNVEHSKKTAEALRTLGLVVEHIDGQTPDVERDRIIKGYRAGHIHALTNYDILTKGFDVPNTEGVVFNCSTASVIRYCQGTGRAERPAPGKTHGIMLDMSDNVFRFGFPDEDRVPTIAPLKEAGTEGVKPVKACPHCGLIIAANLRVCPECNTEQPVKEKKKSVKETQFEELEKSMVKVQEYRFAKSQEEIDKIPSELLDAFAKLRGYKKGWVAYQMARRGGRKIVKLLDYDGDDYFKQKGWLEKAYNDRIPIDATTWQFEKEEGGFVYYRYRHSENKEVEF